MNQHLQKIRDFLQQAENLNAEEKAMLTKAVKSIDSDLTITEFKLDRTEKVKRTTAILLEETIEELEQKRKSVEEKNRYLEIEAALERVRAVAMGMQKPDDMLDVCRVICSQLEMLNVTDIRNVQTAIIYEAKELYINYEYYRLHDKALVTEVGYDHHPIQTAFVKQMLEGPGAFFNRSIEGQAIKEWLEYQKTTNVFIDDHLAEAESLNYYWYSMGPVALGLSTYTPLNKTELEIFERFRNVFGLAYTRYLDVETALTQAREAQIQLALERVRARTMAMHSSNELAEASYLLEQQVAALGIKTWGCAFNIFRENDSLEWFSNLPAYIVPRENMWQRYYEACQRGETLYIEEFAGEACTAHYEYIATIPIVGEALQKMKAAGTPFPTYQLDHVAPFKYGYLMFITFEPVPEAYDIFKRFAKVFEQTYTRFLDLQKAEAQSREAQIQLALERVRARTMAMHHSAELADTASVLFEQIKDLGFETWSCGFCIWKKDELSEVWMAADSGGLLPPMLIPYKEEPTHRDIYEASLRGETHHEKIWEGAELADHYNFLRAVPSVKEAIGILEASGLTLPEKQCYYVGFFNQGYLLLITKEPQQGAADLSRRFAGVFNLTYTRFNDLKLAEAHAIQAEEDLIKLHTEKKRAEEALTNLQSAQKQLIQSEKMASLGELTAGIAHEIQNPLNFVNNFSEVNREMIDELEEELKAGNIEDALAIAADIKQNEEKINHHGKRADGIVKGMLQHSRSSAGEKQPTNLNSIADEFFKLSYHGLRAKDKTFNAEVITNFDDSLPKVNAIPQDIGRVMLNLFNNAFYAVNQKAKTAGTDYKPTVELTTFAPPSGGWGAIVRDNGIGMPDHIKEKIMQPFFTTKPTGEGTGLGLSLTYDMVVKAHGGTINVETAEGEFSEFTVTLPLNQG